MYSQSRFSPFTEYLFLGKTGFGGSIPRLPLGLIEFDASYTNINGGLGLFAARATQGVYGIGYTTASVQHLIEGDETAALNFCTPNPFSDFYCD